MVGTFRLLPLPDTPPTVQAWCHGVPGAVSSPHLMVPFWYPSIVIWREWAQNGEVANVRLCFHGPQPKAYVFKPESSVDLIGIAFAPELAQRMLGVSNTELAGQIIDWCDTRYDYAVGLASRGSDASHVAEVMANAVLHGSDERATDEIDHEIEHAIAIIRRTQGAASLRAIRERIEISERRFRTRFKDRIGTSAKEYSKLLRANALVGCADRQGNPNWAALSQRFGYFDQAHMINDLRKLTGLSPVRLLAERQAEGKSTL